MAQALYRKYRSKNLAEMVGQEHITEALASAIKSGRISHAYLFTGPRGVGKTSAARILAHEINDLPYDETEHLDIIEIDAASNRRIDDIRDLRDKVHIAPTSSKYKIYIIDEVHMLTGESFNALLKTLEEPPAHVVFILATTEVHKLPATIISRTQRFNFRLVEKTKVTQHLRDIAQKESISIDDEALELVAEHGEGSFRDSINLLDQLANANISNIDAAIVERSLGLASKKAITQLIKSIISGDIASTNQQLTELEAQGASSASLLPQLTRQLQDIAIKQPALYKLIDQLIDVPRSYNPRLKLRTTLVQFAMLQSPAPKAAARPVEPPVASKPAPVAPPPAVLDVEKKPGLAPAPQPKEEPPHAEGNKLTGLDDDQWAAVMAAVKEESAPLQGILRQAQPEFDVASQTVTLKFRYALHQKRADDAKSKKAVASAMLNTLGGAPIILTALDVNATPPELRGIEPLPATTTEKPQIDDTTKSVIELMGGGELVNA